MGDNGVICFCQPFEFSHNHSIQKLDFSSKGMSFAGFSAIGKTFGTSNTNLSILDLSRNHGEVDKSVLELCNSASSNNMQPFPYLTYLDVSNCQVGPLSVLALVQTLFESGYQTDDSPKLTLVLNHNPLIGQSPTCLSSFFRLSSHRLTSLSLTHCDMDDEGVRALVYDSNHAVGYQTTLTSLNLSFNRISANGAKFMSESFLFISTSCPLEQLILVGNPIGPDGVQAIAAKLQPREDIQTSPRSLKDRTCTSLREIDLSNTGCGIAGAEAILQCGGSLHSVRLFDNHLKDGFLSISKLLVGGHPNLRQLDLGGNRASEDEICTLLQSLRMERPGLSSSLQVLELGGNQFTSTCEENLKQLKMKWPKLDVVHNRIQD
jgi:Ran GTPase-activating protein (RanGAP) involved in mRNA processing and transport